MRRNHTRWRNDTFVGIPYDWSRPKFARLRERWWNVDDPRVFTPKSFGWGYDINLAAVLVHLRRVHRR